jgi:tol-pal system protein YbgF
VWLAVPALAGDAPADSLEAARAAVAGLGADLARLQRERLDLAQAVPPTDPGAGAATARLAVRLTQLEQELRTVTGRVEELSFQVRRLEERLDKAIADIDFRLSEGGRAAAPVAPPQTAAAPSSPPPVAEPSPPAPPPSTAPGPAVPPASAGGPRVLGPVAAPSAAAPADPTPTPPQTAAAPPPPASSDAREAYARAFSLLQKGSYAEAEAAFSAFLQQHKGDPLNSNARYWLAETHYARADYQRAAEAFLDAYEKDKNGAKAPDALLKLGMSLANLGKTKEACASFRELGRAFPEAPASIRDRARDQQQKLKCP